MTNLRLEDIYFIVHSKQNLKELSRIPIRILQKKLLTLTDKMYVFIFMLINVLN